MPIKLIDNSEIPKTVSVLDKIEFNDSEEDRFFKLSDTSGNEIRVQYIPKFVSTWDYQKYDIILFENPYLTAENDIFQLYENSLAENERLGWIFPVAALDSNENDYVEDRYFKHYRYVAYWKLLALEHSIKYQENKPEYRLSEIFPHLIVCILSKQEINKIENFKIENYILSFLKFDYLLYNGSIKGVSAFNKANIIHSLRKGSHKLTIKKSAFDVMATDYTKSLFLSHLYQTDNFLVKYVFLYQILEHFIQEIADAKLDELIDNYKKNQISKNTLRELIAKFNNDRTLLKKVFARTTINNELRKNFVEKCTFLFKDIGEETHLNYDDVIYDLRNLITHRYRAISYKTEELKEITCLFEAILLELLINFNDKEEEIEEEDTAQPKKPKVKKTKQKKPNWFKRTGWKIRRFFASLMK